MPQTKALPSFAQPPVREVAISMQFRPNPGFKTVHIGLLWDKFRVGFPHSDDLAPFTGLEERSSTDFQIVQMPPLRRVRMSSEDLSMSIQLQEGRLIANWLKSTSELEYPRFEGIFQIFVDALEKIALFFEQEGIGKIEPTHYELTYVNELGDVEGGVMSLLAEVLNFCKWNQTSEAFSRNPTVVNFAWQFAIPNDGGKLVVNVSPARRSNGTEVILLVLKCVVQVDQTKSNMSAWFESAHEAIVRSFDEMTTAEAHTKWGKVTTNVKSER